MTTDYPFLDHERPSAIAAIGSALCDAVRVGAPQPEIDKLAATLMRLCFPPPPPPPPPEPPGQGRML